MKSNTILKIAPEDRRSALRQATDELAFNVETQSGTQISIHIENVSRRGIGFICSYPLQCGETVTITAPPDYELPPCQAHITRIELTTEGIGEPIFLCGAAINIEDQQRHAWFLRLRSN